MNRCCHIDVNIASMPMLYNEKNYTQNSVTPIDFEFPLQFETSAPYSKSNFTIFM